MSAGDGLQKLAEYLQQTRKQAEMAIDVLNERVAELQAQNDELQQLLTASQSKYDGLVAEFEQYKQENTLKARFKERDDWKALVDRITRDRDRLQEEVQRLESQLHGVDNGSDERKTEESDDLGRRKPLANGALTAGSSAGAGVPDEVLKQKLHQAREEADHARQQLIQERAQYEEEVQRLRAEVSTLRQQQQQQQQQQGFAGTNWVSTIGKSLGFLFSRPSPAVVQAPIEHV